jgi:hypothetical protein
MEIYNYYGQAKSILFPIYIYIYMYVCNVCMCVCICMYRLTLSRVEQYLGEFQLVT